MRNKMMNYTNERLLNIVKLSLPPKAFDAAKAVSITGIEKVIILKNEFEDSTSMAKAKIAFVDKRDVNHDYQELTDKVVLFRGEALSPRGIEALSILDEREARMCAEA